MTSPAHVLALDALSGGDLGEALGSADQVTQIIGRVLRQPGAQDYPAALLNTAHCYTRIDEKGVFESIIKDVRQKLTGDVPRDRTLRHPKRRAAASGRHARL